MVGGEWGRVGELAKSANLGSRNGAAKHGQSGSGVGTWLTMGSSMAAWQHGSKRRPTT